MAKSKPIKKGTFCGLNPYKMWLQNEADGDSSGILRTKCGSKKEPMGIYRGSSIQNVSKMTSKNGRAALRKKYILWAPKQSRWGFVGDPPYKMWVQKRADEDLSGILHTKCGQKSLKNGKVFAHQKSHILWAKSIQNVGPKKSRWGFIGDPPYKMWQKFLKNGQVKAPSKKPHFVG